MKLVYDREALLACIDAVVRKTMTMDLTWDWILWSGLLRRQRGLPGPRERKNTWTCSKPGPRNTSSWAFRSLR